MGRINVTSTIFAGPQGPNSRKAMPRRTYPYDMHCSELNVLQLPRARIQCSAELSGGFTHLNWLWASLVPTVVVCDAVRLHVIMYA